HRVSGTLPFASPERLLGSHFDTRSDIYSLGKTMAHLMSRLDNSDRTPKTSELGPRIGHAQSLYMAPQISEILGQMIDSDPSRRPNSPSLIAAALTAHASDHHVSHPLRENVGRSYLTKVPLIGHSSLLTSIAASLHDATLPDRLSLRTAPRVYILSGEAGIGK